LILHQLASLLGSNWNSWSFQDQARDIVEVEFEAAEKAELEALKAERWHAIWEGQEPLPLKLTKTEDV